MSKVLAREIKVETLAASLLGDIPTAMKMMFNHYDHYGLLANSLSLTTILGRQPRSIEEYIKELAGER